MEKGKERKRGGGEEKPATRAALLARMMETEASALQKKVDCIKTREDDENAKDTLVAFFLQRYGLHFVLQFRVGNERKN